MVEMRATGDRRDIAERTKAVAGDCPPASFPAEGALDEQLETQRLRLVRLFSIGLSVVGGTWTVAYLAYLVHHAELTGPAVLVTADVAMLSLTGLLAVCLCRLGRLGAAACAVVFSLIATATLNLAVIANCEGVGMITYCVAVGLAALALEGRALLALGGLICIGALAGTLLHVYPPVTPLVLPESMASLSLVIAGTLGLAYAAGLFWLFSGNLTRSRAEAWRLARRVADAGELTAERTRELEVRGQQLEAKNAELSDFLYVVSHDLRAPLINLEGFSRALQDSIATLAELMPKGIAGANGSAGGLRDAWPALEAEVNESLEFILRGVSKMDFLVGGLLELSRIDSRGRAAVTVDLNAAVDEVLASQHFRISERSIAVRVDPLPTVEGDAMRLSQVFGNLVDNAIKYMKPEGAAQIHIGCRTNGAAHHFFVRDTGIGIRPEDQVKVFRLFTRIHANGASGEGLGLTAVKKIVEKHEGRIWVESEPGQGSTFWFSLPKESGAERKEHDATSGTH